MKHILYADDITIYASCNNSNFSSILLNVQSCVAHIVDWLTSNHLKINVEKTVTFLCGPKRTISNFQSVSVNIQYVAMIFQFCLKLNFLVSFSTARYGLMLMLLTSDVNVFYSAAPFLVLRNM